MTWIVPPERAAKQCPRCGFPLAYPTHNGKPCEPPTVAHLHALVKRMGRLIREGREDEWREMGSHTW